MASSRCYLLIGKCYHNQNSLPLHTAENLDHAHDLAYPAKRPRPGVFFRESMAHKANELGVTGWVRNRSDGSVEAMLQGPEPAVQALVSWARTGPQLARVNEIRIEPGEGDYTRFSRLDTA